MADYEKNLQDLIDRDCGVVAMSTDTEEDARSMVEEHGLSYTVGYGLSVPGDAKTIGAYFNAERGLIQPANFLLQGSEIINATYSTGPLGRLRPYEAAGAIDFYAERENG